MCCVLADACERWVFCSYGLLTSCFAQEGERNNECGGVSPRKGKNAPCI